MLKKLSAEAFGTFWLVFGGCGSAVLAAGLGIGFAGVAKAFGLTVLTMAYAVGPISAATSTRRSRSASPSAAASPGPSSSPTGSPR